MDFVANPVVLYACLALGGVGVALALPRPRFSPQVVGGLLAAIALGGVFVALGMTAGESRPGMYFYLFSAIALGGSLRVISHPKPVYAALYFILTILSSSALYLMLSAEFMAFALIIIYAGAILITYLFVIMLAEQAPSESEVGSTSPYDRYSREPVAATAVGFVLLALLSGMLSQGVRETRPAPARMDGAALLERMPRKVLASLDRQGLFPPRGGFERPAVSEVGGLMDASARTIRLSVSDPGRVSALPEERLGALSVDGAGALRDASAGSRVLVRLPADLRHENLDGVGFALIAEHPMALELAGVILLMAMLGAVVLARKQIEMSEAEKAAAASAARSNGRP